MSVFRNITVQPSYGKRAVLLTWDVAPDYQTGDFFIFKSPDGSGGWELVNSTPVSGTSYEVADFVIQNLSTIPHFRILLEFEGNSYDSPTVGIFDDMTRREYAAMTQIMRREYLGVSRGNGMRVLHYTPKTKGELCDSSDPDTGQIVGTDCPPVDPEEECFGQRYKGGFRTPYYTWCRLDETGPTITMDYKEGLGAVDEFMSRARFLAFPHPRKNDLIVNPRTDDRYAVSPIVKPYKFRGLFPIAYDVQLELLPRSDVRYRVPIPDPLPELTPTVYL